MGYPRAAKVIGAVALAEMPHLRFPGTMVAGELMHEDDRYTRAGFLVMQADAVIGRSKGHGGSPRILDPILGTYNPGVTARQHCRWRGRGKVFCCG